MAVTGGTPRASIIVIGTVFLTAKSAKVVHAIVIVISALLLIVAEVVIKAVAKLKAAIQTLTILLILPP